MGCGGGGGQLRGPSCSFAVPKCAQTFMRLDHSEGAVCMRVHTHAYARTGQAIPCIPLCVCCLGVVLHGP